MDLVNPGSDVLEVHRALMGLHASLWAGADMVEAVPRAYGPELAALLRRDQVLADSEAMRGSVPGADAAFLADARDLLERGWTLTPAQRTKARIIAYERVVPWAAAKLGDPIWRALVEESYARTPEGADDVAVWLESDTSVVRLTG